MGFRGEEEGGEERGRRVGAGGRVDVAADRERERERRGHGMAASNTSGARKKEKKGKKSATYARVNNVSAR